MYIYPDSEIHILQNVPLSDNYENTVNYRDKITQASEFLKYEKYRFTEYSYQRAQVGAIRLEIKYENLYDCNYMMFKNRAFEDKWWYAFIVGCSYVSNEVTEVYYKIDVMQTWCYDYKFLDTFVERRHSRTDELYSNTQPEGLELGSSFEKTVITRHPFLSFISILSAADIPDGDASLTGVTVHKIGGTNKYFRGLYTYIAQEPSQATAVINWHNSNGKADSIVAVYISPTNQESDAEEVETVDDVFRNNNGGYIPKNKKLLTYPYKRLVASNNSGISVQYKYEYLKSNNFRIERTGSPIGEARMVPVNYDDIGTEIDNAIIYSAFPTCAFVSDAFSAWWAQNKNNYIATINSITKSYDTNSQIAANTWMNANANARDAQTMTRRGIDAGVINAQQSAQAAGDLYRRTAGYNYSAKAGSVNPLNAGAGRSQKNITADAEQALQDLTANANALVGEMNAANSAQYASANADTAFSMAQRNAAVNYKNSNLSNLTNKENAVNQMMAKKQDLQNMPDTSKGNAQSETLNYLFGGDEITFMDLGLKREYAERIDDYFTAYGYAQNKLMGAGDLNDRLTRKHFTFIRTVGANLTGKVNVQDLDAIRGVYDNGVTIWDNLEDVGNYELDNGVKS